MADEIDQSPTAPPQRPNANGQPMTPNDVLRGVWRAYLTGLTLWGLFCLPSLLGVFPLGALMIGIGAIGGLILTLPASFAALATYYTLRAITLQVRWWVPILASTLILSAVFASLAQDPMGAIWALFLGPIAGYAFWKGAVGHVKSAHLQAGAA